MDFRTEIDVPSDAREAIEVRAPFDGSLVGRIPRGTPEDVRQAAQRARRAQADWARLAPRERGRVFLRFHDLVLDRQREGLDFVQRETGKARLHALEELLDVAVVARHYAIHGPALLKPRRRRGAFPLITRAWELRHPVGLVGCISPWNYPLNLPVTDSVAALMAGNAVLLKPDHQTSHSALWAVKLLREAGLPRELLQVVTGMGPELGPAIVDSVDFVMFTGSTRTGKVIAQQAASRLIGSSLELGGKNPMIVLEDADLAAAADGAARGSFVGAGQVCVSIERLYVPRARWDEFARLLVERTRSLRLSAALDFSADMGSLTSERQLRTVREHVEDALAKGARLLAGGRPRPDLGPWFHEPTILAGVAPGMKAFDEETFGPVVSLYPYDRVEEAIDAANATPYGLNASVWSKDPARAFAVATRIRAGTVNVNEAYAATWASVDAPMGGMKESGLSRRHGEEGLLKYTEAQTVAVQRWMPLAPPRWLAPAAYARLLTRWLKWVRHLPGLR